MVENLGKFSRIVPAGLVCIMCPLESVVGRVSLRVQQLDVPCETKTKARIPVASARHAARGLSRALCPSPPPPSLSRGAGDRARRTTCS